MSDTSFEALAAVWTEAEAELLAAEAVLNQLADGTAQAGPHILRGWKLMARLSALQQDASSAPSRIDSFEHLKDCLSRQSLVTIPQKREAAWQQGLEALFTIDGAALDAQAGTPALPQSADLYALCDDLNAALTHSWNALKRHYGRTLLQRLHLTRGTATVLVVAMLCLLYCAVSASVGIWNPRDWMARRYEGFLITSSKQDWGSLQLNKSVEERPLTIAGVTFEKGLGTHAYSDIMLKVPAGSREFSGACGVDAETRRGSIKCQVLIDGTLRLETPLLRSTDAATPFIVDLGGSTRIELRVLDGGDGVDSDHADWVNLQLMPESQ